MIIKTTLLLVLVNVLCSCGYLRKKGEPTKESPIVLGLDIPDETDIPDCTDMIKFGGLYNHQGCIDAKLAEVMEGAVSSDGGTVFSIDDTGLALTNFHVVLHCLQVNQDKIPRLTGKPIVFDPPLACSKYNIIAIPPDPHTDSRKRSVANRFHLNMFDLEDGGAVERTINSRSASDWALIRTDPNPNYLKLSHDSIDPHELFVGLGHTRVYDQPGKFIFNTKEELLVIREELSGKIQTGALKGIQITAVKSKLADIEELLSRKDQKKYWDFRNSQLWTVGSLSLEGGMYKSTLNSPDFESKRVSDFPESLDSETISLQDERINDWYSEYNVSSENSCHKFVAPWRESIAEVIVSASGQYPALKLKETMGWRLRNLRERPDIQQETYADEINLLDACVQDIKGEKCQSLAKNYQVEVEEFEKDYCIQQKAFDFPKEEIVDQKWVAEYKEAWTKSGGIVMNMTVTSGMSGSPIVSASDGKVIGIIYGSTYGKLRTLVVPIETIRRELRTVGIELP